MNLLDRVRTPEGLLDPLLTRLVEDPQLSGTVALVGLLVAVGIGAVHALGPGHGKVLIGAYLAGSRGRARDAVALGVLVAAMHTGSVLIVASLLGTAQRATENQPLEAALGLLVSLGVVLLGGWMVLDRVRRGRTLRRSREPTTVTAALDAGSERTATLHDQDQDHDHQHDQDHDHDHEHGHDHQHGHSHELPDGVAPLSRAGLVALAGAGGLLPSPAAVLVLVTALALGRTGYGIALLLAFSVGLAVTLSGIGLAIVRARVHLEQRTHRPGVAWAVQRIPLASAYAVLAGGLIMTWAAVTSF